ncbi:MAG: bifunctional indole-3-glycerol-phosphate synthase TrpC/phosphoribosylanthranilate isomerase TrpF [Polyangiaceae bacterium]
MVLDAIVQRTRRDVAARKDDTPLHSFDKLIAPSDRSLEDAMRSPGTGFILECKKASPSQGVIRADFDPSAIAASYAPFASAISVLTDAPHFQGSHAYLRQVRQHVRQPVLCKDFIVDPYQIFEARHHGADAVLLMCSLLSSKELAELYALATELGLDALIEVHDSDEVVQAVDAGARIIGINNRNLKTLDVDLATTDTLAPLIPDGAVRICESGIRDHADVVRLRSLVDGFLVGTSLMRHPDLDSAVRQLLFGRVKICGLTNPQDALRAHGAGALYGGLVFWPGSSRAVSADTAPSVMAGAPLRWVGVFVDAAMAEVHGTATTLGLSAVQLHGSEDDAYVRALREVLPSSCQLWRAKRMGGAAGTGIPDATTLGMDRVLLDAFHAEQPGGTGQRFGWDAVASHAGRHEIILSGGLAPENIQEADAIGCWGLDLSSGVEAEPGKKDAALLENLFFTLRSGAVRSNRDTP